MRAASALRFVFAVLLPVVGGGGCPATPMATGPGLVRPSTTVPAETTVPGRTVVVAPGDTLTSLAATHGVRVEDLVEVNGLASPVLVVGQRLFVPDDGAAGEPRSAQAVTASVTLPDADDASPSPPTAPTTSPNTALLSASLRWPVDGVVLRDFAAATPATARRAAREAYEGLLIGAPAGTPVRSAAAGVVAFAGSQGTTNGTFVVVEHDDELVTIYAHLAAAAVVVGQRVAAGDVVGEIGTTGLTGASPRVQFQVRRRQAPIDPVPLLPP
jgi:murein DD-endopeptidase MepM/ murein hydrolase activator NlpD